VRAFHTTVHTRLGAVMQPMLGLFDFGQRQGVLAAGELAGLEAAQPVGAYSEQHFLRESVDTGLGDRPVLEVDREAGFALLRARRRRESSLRGPPAGAGLVKDHNRNGVVGRIYPVFMDLSHRYLPSLVVGGGW
jgi:hypothetical protein